MRKILVLTDFSKVSGYALEAGIQLGEYYKSEIIVYHNFEHGEEVIMALGSTMELTQIEFNHPTSYSFLNEWSQIAKEKGVGIKFMFSSSQLEDKIVEIGKQMNIDLIIMGHQRNLSKSQFRNKRNTQLIIESVDRPVLVIKEKKDNYRFKNIVFASAFNLKEQEVFKHFLQLIDPPKETIIHLLAIDTANFFSQPSIVMTQAMQDFQEIAKPIESKIHFYPDYSISSGVRHFLEEIKPDLLVMSNKIDKPIKRALQGNPVIKIAMETQYPMLSIDYS